MVAIRRRRYGLLVVDPIVVVQGTTRPAVPSMNDCVSGFNS
jgi:hypothetical protein